MTGTGAGGWALGVNTIPQYNSVTTGRWLVGRDIHVTTGWSGGRSSGHGRTRLKAIALPQMPAFVWVPLVLYLIKLIFC